MDGSELINRATAPSCSGLNLLFVMRALFCVCVYRETMQQPGCITSAHCFWALVPNFWRKTWLSWTGWRRDWQRGRRPPWTYQTLHLPVHRLGKQGTTQPSGAQTPAFRLLDKMDLVTKTTCLCESGAGYGGVVAACSEVEPVAWNQRDWSSHRSLSWGQQKGRPGWRSLGAPCVGLTSSLYFNMHIYCRHLCLIDLLFRLMWSHFLYGI